MKRAVVFAFVTVLAAGTLDVAMAAPAVKARPVVPVPSIGISRKGGAPVLPVSRGLRSVPQRAAAPAGISSPVPAHRLQPQRAQVLGLRHRVALRYKGHGRGARLAIELP
jgi:hypothetical protein